MTTNRFGLHSWCAALCAAGLLMAAHPADAQIVRVSQREETRNVFNVNLGYFALKGLDSRDDNDVIKRDRLDELSFNEKDFNGFSFGGEYHVAAGPYFEVGGGIGYYQKSVPSVYTDFVNDNGREIAQDLKLRIVPITLTARYLFIGRNAPVQPYIGAGVGFFNWHYSEVGDFVDFSDGTVFSEAYKDSGTAVGPVVFGGVRVPAGDAFSLGGEIRWQDATGDIEESGFLGNKIDLGGFTTSFTMQFRF